MDIDVYSHACATCGFQRKLKTLTEDESQYEFHTQRSLALEVEKEVMKLSS